jgi:hypothetical protein
MSTYDLPRLNNFNAVASHYAGIKPMISKVHTLEQDVRPLGDRKRKLERVKKFSDDCYAYYDGNGGDNIKFWDYGSMHKISDEMHVALAPIVWTRKCRWYRNTASSQWLGTICPQWQILILGASLT